MIFPRQFPTFLFIAFSLVMTACQEDKTEKSIEEIQADGQISSIIRSPVTADGLKDTSNVARLDFSETSFDFGEVKEGEIVTHTFNFTNNGSVPLIIDDAHSTCGCTIPEWPKNPIGPGKSGEIKVKFNTKNKLNYQEKPVIISANTYPSITKVFVKGYVRPQSN